MTVLEQKLLTAVVTDNTADEGISSVVLGGSPDPRIQLMSLGSSDGSTLLRSCFTSDFASEKFIFTISLPLSAVLWIIWSSNINLTSSWEVSCLLLSVLWRLWMHYRHLLVRSVVQDGWGKKNKKQSPSEILIQIVQECWSKFSLFWNFCLITEVVCFLSCVGSPGCWCLYCIVCLLGSLLLT